MNKDKKENPKTRPNKIREDLYENSYQPDKSEDDDISTTPDQGSGGTKKKEQENSGENGAGNE